MFNKIVNLVNSMLSGECATKKKQLLCKNISVVSVHLWNKHLISVAKGLDYKFIACDLGRNNP